jgi:hypothetical protein
MNKVHKPITTQNYRLFVEVILSLEKFSEFEKYVVRHVTVQIYELMTTNCGYESHKRGHSAKIRLMHNVGMHICLY